MIGPFLIFASISASLAVWLGGVGPYLSRHGGFVITGANWTLSAWADWQQCSEFARNREDAKAATLSRLFLLAQTGIILGIILMLCGA